MLYWMMACGTLDVFLCGLLDRLLGPDPPTPAEQQMPWRVTSSQEFAAVQGGFLG